MIPIMSFSDFNQTQNRQTTPLVEAREIVPQGVV